MIRLVIAWWRHNCKPLRMANAFIDSGLMVVLLGELATNRGFPLSSLTIHHTPAFSRSKKMTPSTLSFRHPSWGGSYVQHLSMVVDRGLALS